MAPSKLKETAATKVVQPTLVYEIVSPSFSDGETLAIMRSARYITRRLGAEKNNYGV